LEANAIEDRGMPGKLRSMSRREVLGLAGVGLGSLAGWRFLRACSWIPALQYAVELGLGIDDPAAMQVVEQQFT
jgi:hypothetical protein